MLPYLSCGETLMREGACLIAPIEPFLDGGPVKRHAGLGQQDRVGHEVSRDGTDKLLGWGFRSK